MTPCKSERQQGSHGGHQGGFLNFCVDAVIDVVSLLKPPEEAVGLGIHSASPPPGGIINPGFPYSQATGPCPPTQPPFFPSSTHFTSVCRQCVLSSSDSHAGLIAFFRDHGKRFRSLNFSAESISSQDLKSQQHQDKLPP